MTLPVTLATAGAAALINLWLAVRILCIRFGQKILYGDGGDARLAARMRAQLNFAEYTPLILILIAAIEWSAGSSIWLAGAGALYIVGRVAHPIGMDGFLPARQFGTVVTLSLTGMLGLTALTLVFVGKPVMATDGPVVPSIYRG
ncbi:GST-like protein [Sphingomonas spermidinifaciens]|uniref:GST-like protein n=1 Tax=Sphingomonas spermidinifaciens TaxID=1141889 RepID=A0A2A4BA26_9SPHN|nr:MAPEG family protein [Sphingomonas spermidinifaciens]PCD04484.1 GST-like protein [Sphingomonas spermidinifaciens]